MAGVGTYYIKRGSRAGIRMRLLQGNGQPMPLADATSIRLQLSPFNSDSGPLKMNRVATVVDMATGEVEAIPDAVEVDTPGPYKGEWRITYSGGDIIIPNNDYIRFIVLDDLAP